MGNFTIKCKRVCLVHSIAIVARADIILIKCALAQAGNKALPDTGLSPGTKLVACSIPLVEVSHYEHLLSIRCPHRKICSLHPVNSQEMSAQLFVQAKVISLVEKIEVILGQHCYIVGYRMFHSHLTVG